MTLLTRPAATVVVALSAFVDRLRILEPDQYYQPPSDLHHTVLSLFTATSDYSPYLAQLSAYREAVDEVAAETPPFSIGVRGVTLTPGAVLAQGFPLDGTLKAIRERLRAALGARALGDALDQRYRLATAHMTLIRFVQPLRDGKRFVEALHWARAKEFGVTRVDCLAVVFGDWYHTGAREQMLHSYPAARATNVQLAPFDATSAGVRTNREQGSRVSARRRSRRHCKERPARPSSSRTCRI